MHYTCLLSDQCVYIKHTNDDIIIISVHVDDMTIYASTTALVEQAESDLVSEFEITCLGGAKQLLGMEIHCDHKAGTITLTQAHFIDKILRSAGMENCNPAHTPMNHNIKLVKLSDDENFPEIRKDYQTLLGGLMYAAITTHPDITYTVQCLLQFSSNPSPAHHTALKCCYQYLKGTCSLRITFRANNDPSLMLYSDADWGSNLDNQKSISGYVSTLAGGVVTWQSKKQPTTALSSMEAEYMALSNSTREVKWLRSLLTELGLPPTSLTTIYVDNRGTIEFTNNAGFHARSKHIDIRHHFIQDSIACGEATVRHCPSEDNLADIFTKPLSKPIHCSFVEKLGMISV
jgi:hypothetical protein